MWVTVGFSKKCTARSLRLSVQTHPVVGKLLMGLMLMLIAFLLSLLGSGCTVHDLGISWMVFFGCALQKTEVLESHWVADGAWQH